MKKPSLATALAIGSLLLAGATLGAAALTVQAQEPVGTPEVLGGDRAKIVVDDQAGVVRIEIDDKRAVWIDANGLHVAGDVAYGGIMSDVGPTKAD